MDLSDKELISEASAKDTLSETKDTLSEVKDTLSETKDTLSETKDTLSEVKDTLSETKDTITEKIEKLSFTEANKLTDETILQRKLAYEESTDKAIKEAVFEVTKDAFQKIRNVCTKISSVHKKRFVEIYSFEFVKDKSQLYDKNGSKVIFNGIRLSNILKYNHNRFIKELEDFFNEDNEGESGKFYCYYRFWKKDDDSKWSIYVAWNNKSEEKEKVQVKRPSYHPKKSHMVDETNRNSI
jgi:hypothetical protein